MLSVGGGGVLGQEKDPSWLCRYLQSAVALQVLGAL